MTKTITHTPSCTDCVHDALRQTEAPCFSCQRHDNYPDVKPHFTSKHAPDTHLIYVSGKGQPTVQHPILAKAKAEAERLAKLNPTRKVCVVKVVAICTSEVVTKWEGGE